MASAMILSTLIVHAVPSRSEEATVNGFYQRGGPSLSQKWRGADYVAASKALLPAQGDLPRFNDTSGGAIIQHLTAQQNLEFYRDTSVPAEARFADFVAFNQGWVGILQAYARKHDSGAVSDPELAQAMVFTLQATAAEMDLLGEYWPQIPKHVSESRKVADRDLIYSGVTHVLNGAVTTLIDPNSGMNHTELFGVLKALAEALPHTKPALSDEFRAALRQRIESVRKSFPEPDAQARVAAMESQLDP